MIFLKLLTRVLAFTGKEVVETIRRPGAIVSLIVGPFLILLAFGVSYDGVYRTLQAIVVVPEGSGLPTDSGTYRDLETPGVAIADVTRDLEAARARVRDGSADLLVVAPVDPQGSLAAGQRATIRVEYSLLDPVRAANADFLAGRIADQVNRRIIEEAATEGKTAGIEGGVTWADRIPPEVLAEPTRAETANLSPTPPGVITFFGPAAVALILQHIAVTLIALALVRERGRGRPELFRLSPTGTGEIVLGKIVAFLIFGALIAATLLATLLTVFAVPSIASLTIVAGAILLLLIASLAYGTAIAAVSDSERQAVQLSLLMLLTAVFFSGFVLPVDEFGQVGRAIAAALPVTHGVRLLQDLMLDGVLPLANLLALVAISALLLPPSLLLLRRSLVDS